MPLRRKKIKQTKVLALIFVIILISGYFLIKYSSTSTFEEDDYGVFLNADASSLEQLKNYDLIVIDAQYFTKSDIELLHQNGTRVYTYLNIGSI